MNIKKIDKLFGNWMEKKKPSTQAWAGKGMGSNDCGSNLERARVLNSNWMASTLSALRSDLHHCKSSPSDVNSCDGCIDRGCIFCLVYFLHLQSFTAKCHLPRERPRNKLLAEFYWSSPKWQKEKNLNKFHLDLYGNLKNALRLSLLTTVFMIAIVFAGQSILYSITNCQLLTRFPPLLGPMY